MTVLNMNDNNYDRLWEIREVYDILNAAYSKFYNPSGHLASDQVICTFQREGCIQVVYPKEPRTFRN